MSNLFEVDLTLFGEGGDAGAGADGGQTGESADAGQNRADRANVVYGKAPGQAPPDAAEGEAKQQTPKELAAEFEGLIKGRFKDQFGERVQGIIDQRFRETKGLEEQLGKAKPLFELMAQKYGVQADDLDAIAKAVEEDDSYYEQEAAERGMPVRELKEMKRMERENAAFRQAREAREQQEAAQAIYSDWMRQAEELKGLYPGFDFEAEMQNQDFLALIRSPGVNVRTAYEVVHHDEILGGAMQYTAQTIAQKISNDIQARGKRSPEGSAAGQPAVTFKTDVNKLTGRDIDEIIRRVAKGERDISF